MEIDPSKTRYRTLWISDVHLGMKASRPHCLADFLEHHDADRIFLLGDIVDGIRLRKKWHWTADCDRVVQLILEKARNGTQITCIPGNHDSFLRAYEGETVCGIRILLDAEHITADGRMLYMQHGDAFDGLIRVARHLEVTGHIMYHVLTLANHVINAARRHFGYRYWSLARFLKSKSKHAARYIDAYENAIIADGQKRKVSGVVCGHIHQPTIFERDGITYYNTGDWVDHCTLIAEYQDGRMELLTWDVPTAVEDRTPAELPATPAPLKA